jgi:hypothetical protein
MNTKKGIITMLPKYEYTDETGLRHPHLVCVEYEDNNNSPEKMKVLQKKKIYSIKEFFRAGRIIKNKLPKIKGYRFLYYLDLSNKDFYALFLIYQKE